MNQLKNILIPIISGLLSITVLVTFPMLFEGQELGQYLHSAIRLILLLYMFVTLNFYFIEKLKYEGEFQKIMYKGVLMSLLFACFTSIGFFIALSLNPQDNIENFSIFSAWFVHAKEIVKFGLMYTVFVMIWIYFHPNNKVRLRKKALRLAKQNKDKTIK